MSISLTGSGPSIELTGSGSSITLTVSTGGGGGGGGVTDHGALTGLGDDDHTGYALADGSRGAFASTAQGGLADTAVQPGDLGDAAALDVGTTAGTVAAGDDARLSDARTPTAHSHAGADVTSGTVGTARLGSGTADGTTFLRGDQTWQPVSADPMPVGSRVIVPAYVGRSGVSGGGSWQSGSSYATGGTWLSGGGVNEWVEWEQFLSAGTYTMRTIYTAANNAAIVTPSIAGTDLATVDQYSGSLTYNAAVSWSGIVVGTSGVKAIRFTATSKNGSSSSYYLRISMFEFVRTA